MVCALSGTRGSGLANMFVTFGFCTWVSIRDDIISDSIMELIGADASRSSSEDER